MNENQALGSALGTDMQPAPFKEPNYKDLQTLPQVFAEQQRIGNLKAEAAGELKRAELLQQANTASEQAKAAGEVLDKYKGYIDENKKKRAEFPFPEFHPTQDNASSLAGLFSIVSVLGMGLGNSGKQSALNAMNAMSGMMSGWQKGRADLFKYEKEVFDKEFNRIKVIHDDLRKDLSELMQLMPIDKEKAMYKAAELSAKAGSNSIIGTYVRTGRLQEASNLLDSMAKMIQHREDKALQRELATLKKEGSGALPKDKETQNQHRSRFEVIKNIEEIEGLLKDPQFRKLINPTTQVTPELLQRLQKGYPELANKLARVQAIEFQIGGKALTQAEQRILEPIYGWRGKTAAALEAQLAETKRGMQATQDYVESDFPGLKSRSQAYEKIYRSGGDVRSLPEPEAEKPVYAVGDIISKGGKRFKVSALIKNERGDIIDYDVEEVK